MHRMESLFDQGGAWAIVLSRSLPFSVPEAMVFLGGLAGMPMNKFIAALTLGSVPTAFVFAAIGAGWADQPVLALTVSYVLPIASAPHRARSHPEGSTLAMSTAVVVVRVFCLLALGAPLLLSVTGHREGPAPRARPSGSGRVPLLANFAAFGAYVPSLVLGAGSTVGSRALLLAAVGSLLAVAGGALVLRSRAALGPSWSLVPRADQATGLVSTGPYRLVRHPIYLGYAVVTLGQALAFASWPALLIQLFGIVPTFAWRAHAEEKLLSRTFGERYAAYRQRTRMMIPYLL